MTHDRLKVKELLLLLVVGVCYSFFAPVALQAQTNTWQAARVAVGPNPSSSSSWFDPANWTLGVPQPTHDVVIPSGMNVCSIPDVMDMVEVNSITIQSDAALYNRHGLTNNAAGLQIAQDLIIQNNGYYFNDTRRIRVGRDLHIQAGANPNTFANPGGSFIALATNTELFIGRNYLNEGLMAKRRRTNIGDIADINITFETNTQNGANDYVLYYARRDVTAGVDHRTKNTYAYIDVAAVGRTFNFQHVLPLFAGSRNVLATGAFDRILINKPLRRVVNSGTPTGTPAAYVANETNGNVYVPFLAGTVADGVLDVNNDGTPETRGQLIKSGTGNFEIQAGAVIVNNVSGITDMTAVTHGTALPGGVTDNLFGANFHVFDRTTTSPYQNSNGSRIYGGNWVVPAADINVRGNLIIENPNVGTGAYNGASLDLYGNNRVGSEQDICLHLGGNLEDKTSGPNVDPDEQNFSGGAGSRAGFFVGPVNRILESTTAQWRNNRRPAVVFNGFAAQTVEAFTLQLYDNFNDANLGQGITMPNVFVHKPVSTAEVTIRNSSIGQTQNSMRILGHLTIYSGTFRVASGTRLLFGDESLDEINVLALGNANYTPGTQLPNPEYSGRFRLDGGGLLLMAVDNQGGNIALGTMFRGRDGSEAIFEGSSTAIAIVNRESQVSGRFRFAFYGGCRLRARYAGWAFPSSEFNTYPITGTRYASDNDMSIPSAGNLAKRGGVTAFENVFFYNYTTNSWVLPATAAHNNDGTSEHSFSYCTFEGADSKTLLTIHTQGNIRIVEAVFNDPENANVSVASRKTDGAIYIVNSAGSAGGRVGGERDEGTNNNRTNIAPGDRIIWVNPTAAVWYGVQSTAWNDPRNWIIPNDPNLGGTPGTGPTYNTRNLVPGVGTATAVDVLIPRRSLRNCVMDVDVNIDGSFIMEPQPGERGGVPGTVDPLLTDAGSNRTVTVSTGRSMRVLRDILLYWRSQMDWQANTTIELSGNFMGLFNTAWNGTAITNSAIINADPSSTLVIRGSQNQQISPRHNPLGNVRVDKTAGVASFQGVIWETNTTTGAIGSNTRWVFRVNGNLELRRGHLRLLSQTRLDLRGDFIQDNGDPGYQPDASFFEPLGSPINFRGSFYGRDGRMSASNRLVSFLPLVGATEREIAATNAHQFNLVEFGNSNGTMEIRAGLTQTVAGTSNANNNQVVYRLTAPHPGEPDLNSYLSIGTTDVRTNRSIINQGRIMNVRNLNLQNGARLDVLTLEETGGELRIASGGTVNVNNGATFNAIGSQARFVRITRFDQNGRYAFNINGVVRMRYYTLEFMDDNGLNLQANATPVSFGTITYGGGGEGYTFDPPNGITNDVELIALFDGRDAAARAVVGNTPVAAISLISGGQGYTAPPTVFTTGGTPNGTFTATILGSPLGAITIDNPGVGYPIGNATVQSGRIPFNFAGVPAAKRGTNYAAPTAYAIMDNQVTGLPPVPLTTYTELPPVVVNPPLLGGLQARARAVMNPFDITGFNIVNAGLGYSVGDEIQVSDPTGTGTVALVASVGVNGNILTVNLVNGGTGYTNPSVDVVSAFGSGAVLRPTFAPTTISSFIITEPGNGYSSLAPPIVSVNMVDIGNATITVGSTVVNTFVENSGNGFLNLPTNAEVVLPALGATTPASFTFNTPGGYVSEVVVNTGGLYPAIPAIQFSAPDLPSGLMPIAAAIGLAGEIASVDVVYRGRFYKTAPLVAFRNTGEGAGASFRSLMLPSAIRAINVLDGGAGYSSAPTVTLTPGYTPAAPYFETITGTTNVRAVMGAGAESDRVVAIHLATDTLVGSTLTDLHIIEGGRGYTVPPTITFVSTNTLENPTVTHATATATVAGGQITGITLNTNGSGYTSAPQVVITPSPVDNDKIGFVDVISGGDGYTANFPVTFTGGGGTGAAATAIVSRGAVIAIEVTNAGSGYTSAPTIDLSAGSGTGAAGVAQMGAGGAIIVAQLSNSAFGYRTSPTATITGGGSPTRRATARVQLTDTYVESIVKAPIQRFPAAAFSDGIITNTAYGASSRGLTIHPSVSFYRTTNPNLANNGIDTWNTTWWDYAAAASATGGPRIDTIYNVVFPKNPAVDGGGPDFEVSKNVWRDNTNTLAQNRVIFKDAVGTFSGEDFDFDPATGVNNAIGNTFIHVIPNTTPDLMVTWVGPNVKRWDGGPDNTGTSWSADVNWRPDGVPEPGDDIVIDWSLLWVEYDTLPGPNLGRPIIRAPSPVLAIGMDETDVAAGTRIAHGRNLTINPIIRGAFSGSPSAVGPIDLEILSTMRITGTMVIDSGATVRFGGTGDLLEVGESWSNNGDFQAGSNSTVRFYRNVSRTISNRLAPKDPSLNISLPLNSFFNLELARGVTDLSTDVYVRNNLTIETLATFNSNSQFIHLEGNWLNRGRFQEANSTLVLQGGAEQRIRRDDIRFRVITNPDNQIDTIANKQDFYNIRLVKTLGSNVVLDSRTEVVRTGVITFNSGIINSFAGKEFILSQSAGLAGPASEFSHVKGPVGRIHNGGALPVTLTYPVGGGTGLYTGGAQGFSVSLIETTLRTIAGQTSTVPTMFVVEQIEGNINTIEGVRALTPTPPSFLSTDKLYISRSRYWDVDIRPYVSNGSIAATFPNPTRIHTTGAFPRSSFSQLDRTSIALSFNAGLELIQLSTAAGDPIDFVARPDTLPVGDVFDLVVLLDSVAAFDCRKALGFEPLKPVGPQVRYTSAVGLGDPFAAACGLNAVDLAALESEHENNTRIFMGTAYRGDFLSVISNAPTTYAANQLVISSPVNVLGNGNAVLAFSVEGLNLEIIDIRAERVGQEALIRWTTVNEALSERFVVERSQDGQNFTAIGEVRAVSGLLNNYQFTDRSPKPGTNYYRIRQVNRNGSTEYTRIVSVEFDNAPSFVIYPNPVISGQSVYLKLPRAPRGEQAKVVVVDLQGRTIIDRTLILDGNPIELFLGRQLSKGVYIVRTITAEETYEGKIIVQ
jgi:hypothetical protein